MRYLVPCFLLLLATLKSHVDPYPKDLFRSPLGIPLVMAGNFAEMRDNHFHAGLDLKTNGTEGYRVYAAADGWISRIVVSPVGYGKALYVNHPSGHTTVYAHLNRFSREVEAFVKEQQYARKQYRVDLYPPEGRFWVNRGEVIGLSGNSGSSAAPHLHFEIRDAATQQPLNPLLFGLPVEDRKPPRLFRIKVYALGPGSFARIDYGPSRPATMVHHGEAALLEVEATEQPATYRLKGVQAIQANGRIGFGIQAHDYHDGSRNRLGAYRIRLLADGSPLFASEMERFSFAETRYLNAHVDYAERKRHRRWIQRSYRLPGNRLSIYLSDGEGSLNVAPGATHTLSYVVEDVAGNTARLRFEVQGVTPPAPATNGAGAGTQTLPYDRSMTFEQEGFRASFPRNTVYEDVPLTYRVLPPRADGFSDRHVLLDPLVPVHNRYTLAIRAEGLPDRLRPYALLAREDEEGEVEALGGAYEAGYITAKVRTFGTFFVTADTLAPEITSLDVQDGKNLKGISRIRFRIKDDLSGIGQYAGYVDGEWILFAYDAKRNLIEHVFDGRVGPGPHTLRLEVRDRVGNTRRYEARFTR